MPVADLLIVTLQEIEEEADKTLSQVIQEESKVYAAHPEHFKIHSKHLKQEFDHHFRDFKTSFVKGYKYILENVSSLSEKTGVDSHDFELQASKNQDLHMFEITLQNALQTKKPLQFCFKYTGKMMAAVYDLALETYRNKEYSICHDILVFLVTLNPYVCWFWQLLGKTELKNHHFNEAVHVFKIAIGMAPENLEVYKDAVRGCIQAEKPEEALSILDESVNFLESQRATKKRKELLGNLQAMQAYVAQLI